MDGRHGGGGDYGYPSTVFETSGVEAWGQEGNTYIFVCMYMCVCVCVYANERVRGSLCACKRTCLFQDHYTLCMYAYFCKKEKKNGKKSEQ